MSAPADVGALRVASLVGRQRKKED